ncbi:Fic family protein [Methanolobus sp. WCC4]|uniref:Fic family protein n=1 Tax=Methanolobus sp. WCC4 TaxID=3125784 RepID=UPI0030FB5CCA
MSDTDTSLIDIQLLERIDEKLKRLDSMRPLPPSVLRRLNEEMKLMHTYHSNAIEGNTLTLQETKVVLEDGVTIGGKSLREHIEASNTARAFDLVEDMAKGKVPIGHVCIQQLHEVVAAGLLEDAGQYRSRNVRITGAVKTPPDRSKIVRLMDELFRRVRKGEVHPIETASLLHHGFVEIHPFTDGNGRVARLLMNLYLISHGYTPVVLRKEDRKKYYAALRSADRGNLNPFAQFIAKAVDDSLTLYLSAAGGVDELLPLKELAEHTPYSQEYLSLRARQGVLDAVKMGRVWYSSQNAVERYLAEHGTKDE